MGYSSSGLVQTPKSAIVSPHLNKTIVPSGSDCALSRGTNMFVCVCDNIGERSALFDGSTSVFASQRSGFPEA